MTFQAGAGESSPFLLNENSLPTTSSTDSNTAPLPELEFETVFSRFNITTNEEQSQKQKVNQEDECVNVIPTLVFPLGGENVEHLKFPSHVLHYSVSPSARFVYVVGQEFTGLTHLNVWDLHRGTRQLYKYTRMYYVRHFYALNDRMGFAVSSTGNFDKFILFTVLINITKQKIHVDKRLTTHFSTGHVEFWSSCRYKNMGIVFATVDQRGIFIYKYELNSNPFGEDNEKLFQIERDQLSNHYFVGQPFVHDDHVMFLERENFNLKFTGRVVRIHLDDGKMDCVMTTGTETLSPILFGSQMPNRVKHVERNGQLWAIMENTLLNPNYGEHLGLQNKQKFLGVLCLKTWCWRKVCLGIEADYEEISLDVTSGGTIVIIKRGHCSETPVVRGFYFLQNDKPKLLLDSAFVTLVKNYPHLRFADRTELCSIGVPNYLL